MIPILGLPIKIVKLLDANVSQSEVAAGVCMGMFFGFIPLNGPMAILLFVCFLLFKINRLSSIIALPLFKLLYVLGVYKAADFLGGMVLIKAEFLAWFWKWLISLPIIAWLDLNNTLVSGGILVSVILCMPVYLLSRKGIVVLREKYFVKIKESKIVKWFKKLPIISKIFGFAAKVRSEG